MLCFDKLSLNKKYLNNQYKLTFSNTYFYAVHASFAVYFPHLNVFKKINVWSCELFSCECLTFQIPLIKMKQYYKYYFFKVHDIRKYLPHIFTYYYMSRLCSRENYHIRELLLIKFFRQCQFSIFRTFFFQSCCPSANQIVSLQSD